MEDPESEWQIQEYAAYSKEGDESAAYNTVKWMLRKGYVIGRKMAVTGIVITSAPLVLPPLVVFSAMGVAFSVPVGLLYASYACTNKLMSILLPIPPSPPLMLEYYTDQRVDCKLELDDVENFDDDYDPQVEEGYITDEEDNEKEKMEDIISEGVVTDNRGMEDGMLQIENVTGEIKEREQMEGIKEGVEMKPSFDVAGDDQDQGYGEDVGDDSLEEELKGEEPVADPEKKFSDFGDVETTKLVTVKEVVSKENKETEDVNQGVDTEIVFDLDDGRDDYRREGPTLVMNVDEDVDEREMEMEADTLQRENVIEEMEDVTQGVEMGPSFEFAGDDQGYVEDADRGYVEEEPKGKEPLVDENTSHREEVSEDAKLKDEARGHDIVEDDYDVGESASTVAFGDAKDVETTKSIMVKEIESQKLVEIGSKNDEAIGEMRHVVILSNENNFNSTEVEELNLMARKVIGDAIKDATNIESDEKVVRESMGTHEDANMEDSLIHSNADVQEISGLDLLDERNTNNNLESREVGNEVIENAPDENADVMVFKQSPLDTDNAKVAHKKMLSKEGNLDDEKIWEKIGAMRTIVGYKAPSQPTCMGELKALYVFTGVEPPASFQGDGDSDLDEVNAKLKFLMAIVGVK